MEQLVYCSVLTPYYKEDVLFSSKALDDQNEDGVSILFYLQKIYPGTSMNVKKKSHVLVIQSSEHQTHACLSSLLQMNGKISLKGCSARVKTNSMRLNNWKMSFAFGHRIGAKL
jgi:callose synthase